MTGWWRWGRRMNVRCGVMEMDEDYKKNTRKRMNENTSRWKSWEKKKKRGRGGGRGGGGGGGVWGYRRRIYIPGQLPTIQLLVPMSGFPGLLWSWWGVVLRIVVLVGYTGWPPPPKKKNGTVDFLGLCSDQQLSFFTLLDRASFPHYDNTKIIKFGIYFMSNFLWTVIFGICH